MSTRVFIAALCAAFVLALGACGDGESDQERALDQVCDARADIQTHIGELSRLTPTAGTLEQIKQSLTAIADDLAKMREARADLSGERRKQVESATSAFTSELGRAVEGLGTPRSLSGDARTQTQRASAALRDSYREALEPIDCG
jgi:hypothetical protein